MDIASFGLHFANNLRLPKCPHCGVAKPQIAMVWQSEFIGVDRLPPRIWATYMCTSCGALVLTAGHEGVNAPNGPVASIYPGLKQAAAELPEMARTFLQQAYETLHAPDAAAVMAGSAVDAMLKDKKYEKGSLYERIDKAVEEHLLTPAMGDWAHWVRLGSNRPRHADKDKPHISPEEARQAVEFADALGQFLYVLSSRISKGIDDATKATG